MRLTNFGRKLPPAQQRQALALADVGKRLRRTGEELYPGIPTKRWTSEMWDKIYELAESRWVDA